jgi:hypothetical protein
MTGVIRLWVVFLVVWTAWAYYTFHREFAKFSEYEINKAIRYGLNNFYCTLPQLFNCADIPTSFWEQPKLNRIIYIIAMFAVPMPVLLGLLGSRWVIRGFSR